MARVRRWRLPSRDSMWANWEKVFVLSTMMNSEMEPSAHGLKISNQRKRQVTCRIIIKFENHCQKNRHILTQLNYKCKNWCQLYFTQNIDVCYIERYINSWSPAYAISAALSDTARKLLIEQLGVQVEYIKSTLAYVGNVSFPSAAGKLKLKNQRKVRFYYLHSLDQNVS